MTKQKCIHINGSVTNTHSIGNAYIFVIVLSLLKKRMYWYNENQY